MEKNGVSESEVRFAENIAQKIGTNTQISRRQAKSLILKTVLNMSNEQVLDYMDASSPTTVGSHVSRVKSKFRSVEENILNLEEDIDKWEKTERLSEITDNCDKLDVLSERVESDIVNGDDTKYLISYIDHSGNRDVQVTEEDPQDLEVEVIDYKRISSTEELFE